jgi:hypothetical protein
VLRPDATNLWNQIERSIEVLYHAAEDACADLGIEAYVSRSNPFEFPFAIRFECWLPAGSGDPNLTERTAFSVKVNPMPWHQFETEYTVEIEDRGKKRTLGCFGEMDARDIRALITYLVRRGPKPRFRSRIADHRAGQYGVKNKPTCTRPDYLVAVGVVCLVVGIVAAFATSGLGLLAFATSGLGLLAALIGVAIITYVSRQPLACRSTGRPEHHPRILRAYDYWQTVIFQGASGADTFQTRLRDVLRTAPIDGFKFNTERIGYRVLDEVVFREQLVLTARRGIIYCQIYTFGVDLYVGWQSFLNQGRWREKAAARGIDCATNRRVEVFSITPGWESLCEYDYADVNCLTEWTHAQITALVKQLLKELQIDQETVDFKIIRGERSAINSSDNDQKKPKSGENFAGLFRRKS